MRIAITSLSARGESGIAVTLEINSAEHSQRETFLLDGRAVADLGLKVGECSREVFEEIEHASRVCTAKNKALFLLGYGASSPKNLARKLVMKGISKDIATDAVKELLADGFLDPREDARREAEKCVSKLLGRKRITATLFEKGYTERDIKYALASIEADGVDYIELCAERIRRSGTAIPDTPDEKRKLVSKLERYGFTLTEIKEAFNKIKA